MRHQQGFTLIELMVVITIIAIIAAIAVPSYQEYVRRQRAAQAQQAMQVIAGELERFKAKNFSYAGFNQDQIAHIYPTFTNAGTLNVPTDGTGHHYTITLNNAGTGWTMIADRVSDARMPNMLMTSDGARCKTANDIASGANDCGTNSETW